MAEEDEEEVEEVEEVGWRSSCITVIIMSPVLVFGEERSFGQGVEETSDRIERMADPSFCG